MSEDLAGRRLGGFTLVERLGSGAHGDVWRARQVRLDRDVAVKILDPAVARDPIAARRFEREGRAAASLDHPNVVPVFEAGEQDGLVYLAMRLVDGDTLEDRLNELGAMPIDDVVDLLGPIAAALDHAHERDVVHRDVKPSNILIDDGGVWLADFGIAASVRDLGTYTAGVLGTAEYMAPEQANAADVDHRADLYGLGCVAHHLLEGAPPFPGDDLISTLMAHVNEPVPETDDAGRDRFYATALAKNPDDRFQSATDLVGALEALAVPSPASASGPTAPRSGDASVSRRRPLAVAAVVTAMALVAAVAIAATRSGDDPDERAESTTTVADSGPSSTTTTVTTATTDPTTTTEPVQVVIEPTSGGTVEVGTTRSLADINPHRDRFIEPFITTNVLPPLMVVNPDWSFSPWLAAKPPTVMSTEPQRVRWTLRPDARWDDGTAITSTDVSRTLDYITDADASLSGTLLYQGASVEIIDDTTFDIVFGQPQGAHAALFSTIHPVIKAAALDAHVAAGNPTATFLSDGIDFSGGPYLASGFDAGERLTLVRNDGFWGEPALLDRITVRSYDSVDDQIAALDVGELDLAYVEDARATDAARARSIGGTVVDVGVADQYLRLDMNTRKGQMADPSVRVAVATAIDRALIAEAAVTPISGEVVSPLQSLVWAQAQTENTEPFATYAGDKAAAAAILQDAGWVLADDGNRFRDGEPLEITLLYGERSSLAEQVLVQSIVVQLGEVGVRVIASVQDGDQLFTSRISGEFDMVVALDVVNTDPVAASFRFGSQYCPTSFGVSGCDSAIQTNLTGVADENLDVMFAAASVEADPAVRDQLFVDIDARLAELVPSLPLYELPTFVAHNDDLGGVFVDTHRGGPFAGLAEWGYLGPVDVR